MKRRDLIKLLESSGWKLLRNETNHDIYTDGKRCEPIPRHNDISENLAKAIIKRNNL